MFFCGTILRVRVIEDFFALTRRSFRLLIHLNLSVALNISICSTLFHLSVCFRGFQNISPLQILCQIFRRAKWFAVLPKQKYVTQRGRERRGGEVRTDQVRMIRTSKTYIGLYMCIRFLPPVAIFAGRQQNLL